MKESKGENTGQEAGSKNLSTNHGEMPLTGLFLMTCSLSFLIPLTATPPGNSTTHNGMDPSTSMINEENAS